MKKSHLNMSIIVCYIKTSIKAPMLLYSSNDSRGNTVTRAMSFEKCRKGQTGSEKGDEIALFMGGRLSEIDSVGLKNRMLTK